VFTRKADEDLLLTPSKPHPLLGERISSPEDVARYAKQIQRPGYVVLVARGGPHGAIRALAEYPAEGLTNLSKAADIIESYGRSAGSPHVLMYGDQADLGKIDIGTLIRGGYLLDAVTSDGVA